MRVLAGWSESQPEVPVSIIIVWLSLWQENSMSGVPRTHAQTRGKLAVALLHSGTCSQEQCMLGLVVSALFPMDWAPQRNSPLLLELSPTRKDLGHVWARVSTFCLFLQLWSLVSSSSDSHPHPAPDTHTWGLSGTSLTTLFSLTHSMGFPSAILPTLPPGWSLLTLPVSPTLTFSP